MVNPPFSFPFFISFITILNKWKKFGTILVLGSISGNDLILIQPSDLCSSHVYSSALSQDLEIHRPFLGS